MKARHKLYICTSGQGLSKIPLIIIWPAGHLQITSRRFSLSRCRMILSLFFVLLTLLAAVPQIVADGGMGTVDDVDPAEKSVSGPELREGTHPSNLFGMGEPLFERSYSEIRDVLDSEAQMGVRWRREWFSASALMPSGISGDPVVRQKMEYAVGQANEKGIEVVGMCHDFPAWTGGGFLAIPDRDTAAGSDYMTFLDNWRLIWKTYAEWYPNVTYWEIGNEWNHNPFNHPFGYDESDPSSPCFTYEEKMAICADMLHWGSKGVHESNPKAITVMGGLAVVGPDPAYPNDPHKVGFGVEYIGEALEILYQNIESGSFPAGDTKSTDPDDYFQVAAWHPYTWTFMPTKSNWADPQIACQQVMSDHGDGNKMVFLTEMGYADGGDSQLKQEIATYLPTVFDLIRDNMPFVATNFWFRTMDSTATGPESGAHFGVLQTDGTKKPVGVAYQNTALSAHNAPGWGDLNGMASNVIWGWAYDPDSGADPVLVEVYIDGDLYARILADESRPDVPQATTVIGDWHGYSLPWANLPPGTYTLSARMMESTGEIGADLGQSQTVTDSTALVPQWDFGTDGCFEMWDAFQQLDAPFVSEGCLQSISTGADPAIRSFEGLGMDAGANNAVSIKISTTSGTGAQLFWITESDKTWDETKSKQFPITSDGQFHDYVLDLSTVGSWAGTIRQLRLDPTDGSGSHISIDHIHLSAGGTPANQAPSAPIKPTGPTTATVGATCSFSTSATDADGDQVKYGWDWDGDGAVDEWSSLVNSGVTDTRDHSWSEEGDYTVLVKVQDEHGAQSGWSQSLSVEVTGGGSGGESENIALNCPVSASGFLQQYPPANAVDGDQSSMWSSGGTPPAWIRIDLGSPCTVSGVRLLVEQSPAGQTVHDLYLAGEDGSQTLACTFSGSTSVGQWLEFTPQQAVADVRYVNISTTSSPSWVAWSEIEVQGAVQEPDTGHLQYFGYFASAWDVDGFESDMSDYVDHCNFVHVMGDEVNALQQAGSLGMKVILEPYWHLFDGEKLRPDYQTRWDSYAAMVAPYIDNVLAIYTIDEPYHLGYSKAECDSANAAIKASFPNVPILINFAYPSVDESLVIPDNCDIVSFDYYGDFDPIPGYHQILKSKLRPDQKMLLIPDGYKHGSTSPTDAEQQDWVTRANQFYELAKSDSAVIGMMPFLWPTVPEENLIGVETMTVLQDEFRVIGKEIVGSSGEVNLPPSAPATPSGTSSLQTDQGAVFTTSALDPEEDRVKYGWDWDGDGTVDEWSGLVNSGTQVSLEHAWSVSGTYDIMVKAEDEKGAKSGWSGSLSVTVTAPPVNNPPTRPSVPTGPATGIEEEMLEYAATAVDPDGDSISYGWDWDGDGTVDEWSPLIGSGVQDVRSHDWPVAGQYDVRVMARDDQGDISDLSDPLSVSISDPPEPDSRNLAQGATATASSVHMDAGPARAIDGQQYTAWNSGGMSPAWIEIDLGGEFTVTEFRLLVNQYPEGDTTHKIQVNDDGGDLETVNDDGGDLETVNTFSGSTTNNQWLEYEPDAPLGSVSRVRITTTSSPSWVSWREVEVWGFGTGDEPQINNPPRTPAAVVGPSSVAKDSVATYQFSTGDPEGDTVQYTVDWGDGTESSVGPLESGVSAQSTHSWGSSGTYQVTVRATDEHGSVSPTSPAFGVSVTEASEMSLTTTLTSNSQYGIGIWWYKNYGRLAQSFTAVGSTLGSASVCLYKTGDPAYPLTVSIRSEKQGEDMTSATLSPQSVTSSDRYEPCWVTVDLPDITVVPGEAYYLVLRGQPVGEGFYYWKINTNNPYEGGAAYVYNELSKKSDSDFLMKLTFSEPESFMYSAADMDMDGYSNAVEDLAGSDPEDFWSVPLDIDIDGIADVMDRDSDNDNYTDDQELAMGTDPNDPLDYPDDVPLDTDGDGIFDSLDSDIDGDGWSNTDEMTSGSDHDMADSKPGPDVIPTVGIEKNTDEHMEDNSDQIRDEHADNGGGWGMLWWVGLLVVILIAGSLALFLNIRGRSARMSLEHEDDGESVDDLMILLREKRKAQEMSDSRYSEIKRDLESMRENRY